jgi:hypothetical protein
LTFLYFDADCQLAFEAGERLPKMVYNYQHQAALDQATAYTTESTVPQITDFSKAKSRGNEVWTITVANPNAYPFPMGITEWCDLSRNPVAQRSENVKEAKPIGDKLVFIRCTAAPNSSSTFTVEFKGVPPACSPQAVPVAPTKSRPPRAANQPNLALGRPVKASSELVYEGKTNHAGFAVDGQAGTRWSSEFKDGEWLTVNLGESKMVSGVELLWEIACVAEYVIEVSSDGEIWKEVATDARALCRPLMIGEFQIPEAYVDQADTPAIREAFRSFLRRVDAAGVPLTAVWVFDFPWHDKERCNITPDNRRGWQLDEMGAMNLRWAKQAAAKPRPRAAKPAMPE